MTQSQLAEELDLGKVAVGGLIDRLEKSGLVRREADATDRRVNRVFLEPKSKQLIAKMRKVSHRMNAQILEGLVDEKLEGTALTLDQMKRNLLTYLQGNEI
jgi:DNA-binding MarR family transcriptional regulator